MKKFLLPLFLIFSVTALFAQPVNDNCAGLIDLGTVPICPDSVWYTNVDATPTDIGANNFPTGCDGGDITFVGRDVFFQFTTNGTLLDLTITVTGSSNPMGSTPMMNPQVALYRGDCLFDELSLLKCGKAEVGSNEIAIDVFGLDPFTPYYIRISDFSTTATPNSGTFLLCIDEQDPIFTVCDDSSASSAGVLYDCGGPDGDYENNTSESFTICPDLLTAIDGCVTFSVQYFNLELGFFGGGGDIITFFDGPDTNSPVISNIGNNNIGDDGGGGVCYVVQASSGCLTVQLTTNASVVFEGFCGSWETSVMPCDPVDQIDVTPNPTNEDLADFVTTPQSFATITNVDCNSGQYGTFTADESDLGLERGIILTSGTINNAVGPNSSTSITGVTGSGGDADLDALSILSGNGSLSNDACVVELDVFVATNQLRFEYVFGSDEYPEFVNTTFNDIFALLVSGPGIVGEPTLNNQLNVATLPVSNTEVSINTVNNLSNWEYYRYNTGGQSIEYDGLTSDFLGVKKSLTATLNVIPCTTYHLKFAIADRGDSSFDSGVFIGELEGDVPDLSVQFASGVDYLVEDCTGAEDILIITIDNPQVDTQFYDVVVSGTASNGIDYLLNIPNQIVLLPGETQLMYPLIPFTDGITEGIETIIIQLTSNFGCGDIALNELVIEIHDQPLVEIFAGADTAYVCSGTCLQLDAEGGATYVWTSVEPGIFDNPFLEDPVACPTISQWVSVIGFISNAPGCNDQDSIYLQFIDPMIDVVALDPVDICAGDSVRLVANNNANSTGLVWTPDDFLSADNVPNVTATPPFTITYTASLNVSGCIVTDAITINVNSYDPPILTTLDTLLCQGSVLQLADSITNTTTNYQWSPDTYIITDTDIAGAVAIPQDDIVYTLISSSQNNFCRDTFMVNVTVLPAEVTINQGDYAEICLDNSLLLTTTNSTNGVGITWSPPLNLSTTTGPQTIATPTETTEYFVQLVIGQCTVTDSITIRVDSLPLSPIIPVPGKPVYCQGEIINLISPPYIPSDYSDISFIWDPTIGQNSDVTNYNLNVTATETFTYVRTTTNHACVHTDTITIIVIDPGDIAFTPAQAFVCAGDQITVTATSSMADEFTWTTSTGAPSTCPEDDTCPSTTITMNATSVTVTAEADVQGCPIIGSVTYTALYPPAYAFPEPPQVCNGESIILNTIPVSQQTTYEWSTANGNTFSTIATPEVIPTQTTTYYLTISNPVCPVVMDSVTIFVADLSTLSVPEDQSLCANEVVNLIAESNNLGTFSWTSDAPGFSPFTESSVFSSSVDFSNVSVGNYSFTVTFDSGCPDTDPPLSSSFNVEIVGAPNSEIVLSSQDTIVDLMDLGWKKIYTFNEGDSITLSSLTQGASYQWATTGGTILSNSPAYGFLALNDQNYVLTLTNAEGCPEEFFIDIKVIPAFWVIPNAFTPNGDQQNDLFRPLISGKIKIVNFKVYNRWGDLVYNNDNGLNGWDGTLKGKPQPTEVYIYRIEMLRPDKVTVEEKSGDVTLIR
jgi:gliding motility-associated-like protein